MPELTEEGLGKIEERAKEQPIWGRVLELLDEARTDISLLIEALRAKTEECERWKNAAALAILNPTEGKE